MRRLVHGRTALIHDFLIDVRGAERVFATLCDLFPSADVFTAVYDEAGTEGRFAHRQVNTSFLQKARPNAKTFRALLPLYPAAMEHLDLSGYDVVVSSSSAWAHGVLVDPGAVHVCYCHNPFRYAWNEREQTLAGRDLVSRAVLGAVFHRWRQWDYIAAQRVDRYVANSETTRKRIQSYFRRDSEVLYPPVDTERFSPVAPGEVGDAYVVLSELMPHKRIDVAVEAFNRLRRPLIVVGDGPDYRRLRRLAGPTTTFAGHVPDEEVAGLLARSQALVVCATEEFGIAAVEAQAAGRPVVALRSGGVAETVTEGVTGTFFDRLDPDVLAATVAGFDTLAIDPAECTRSAARFDAAHFRRDMGSIVEAAAAGARAPRSPRERARRVGRGLARIPA
jgi:glycosyltransferase involved in cell wall biosynthesis